MHGLTLGFRRSLLSQPGSDKYKHKFNATMSKQGLSPNPVTSEECGEGYGYESTHATLFCTGSTCAVDQVRTLLWEVARRCT